MEEDIEFGDKRLNFSYIPASVPIGMYCINGNQIAYACKAKEFDTFDDIIKEFGNNVVFLLSAKFHRETIHSKITIRLRYAIVPELEIK